MTQCPFYMYKRVGSHVEDKICSSRTECFPFRITPSLEGLHPPEKQMESQQLFPFVKMAEKCGEPNALTIFVMN